MSLNSKLVFTTALSVCSALGCSAESLDLGNNHGRQVYAGHIDFPSGADAGNSPVTQTHIVEHEVTYGYDVAEFFAVSEGNLYWVEELGSGENVAIVLRHCDVENCAASLVSSETLALQGSGGDSPNRPVQVDQNIVYWVANDQSSILSVTSESGAPIERISLPVSVHSLAASDGHLYFTTSDHTICRCSSDDCANTLEQFAMTPPVGVEPWTGEEIILAQDSEYLYLGGMFRGDTESLLRVAKDVNASFEVLMQPSGADKLDTLKVHGDNLYWLEQTKLGRLKTCSASGCASAPTSMLSNLSGLESEVAVDDKYIYLIKFPAWSQTSNASSNLTFVSPGQILRCQLPGGSDCQVIFTGTTEHSLYNLVVDDRAVYVYGEFGWVGDTRRDYVAVIPK